MEIPANLMAGRACRSDSKLLGRVVGDYLVGTRLGQSDDLIGVLFPAHFHAGRTCRHPRDGNASQIRALAELDDLRSRDMTLDEFAVNHRGMAGRQPWSDAEALLD